MPVRDEAAHLEAAVDAVLAQSYPRPFQVVLAVGPSTRPGDDTVAIARRLARGDARVVVVDNPSGLTPAGLNAAIRASDAEVLVRVDGHARLGTGYIARAVETLERTGAVNVGGVQDAVGTTDLERAIAVAMTSRFGTGGSRFHVGGAEGPVDTVYLGVFRRDALEAAGLFDEHLIRNQDYELNIRLRRAGGVVWFDPELVVEYRPRSSLGALARQYGEYGWWKAEVARMYPRSLRPRQVIPAVVTLVLAADLVLGRFLTGRWRLAWLGYGAAVVVAALGARDRRLSLRLLAVYPTMHLSWGCGFIAGLVSGLVGGRRSRGARSTP